MASTTGPILEAAQAALLAEQTQMNSRALARLTEFGLPANKVTIDYSNAEDGIVVVTDGVTALSIQGNEIRLVEKTMSGWGKPSVPLTSPAHLARLVLHKETDA